MPYRPADGLDAKAAIVKTLMQTLFDKMLVFAAV
jgi:hypothetical protein